MASFQVFSVCKTADAMDSGFENILPVSVTWQIRATGNSALNYLSCRSYIGFLVFIRCRNMSLDSEVRKRTEMNGEIGSEQDDNLISSKNTMKTTASLKDNRKWLILNTHVNAAIYSACFWVQIGVLPVSEGFVYK